MTSRGMLIAFEELTRSINPELEFDATINTELIYSRLSKAQRDYIEINFLSGDSFVDNVNAINRRSNILKPLIKRTTTTQSHTLQSDGGYSALFSASDYWVFLSGIMTHSNIATTDSGSANKVMNLKQMSHYDLHKQIRGVYNEPIYKEIPVVIEGSGFSFYLDKQRYDSMNATINDTSFNIVYLAYPSNISESVQPQLAASTHTDIVKLAVDTFIKEYKFLAPQIQSKK